MKGHNRHERVSSSTCPHCEQSLKAPEDMLGGTIECPSCNGSIQLPEPEPQAPPEPAPTQAPKKKIVTNRSNPSGNTKPCPYCGDTFCAPRRSANTVVSFSRDSTR